MTRRLLTSLILSLLAINCLYAQSPRVPYSKGANGMGSMNGMSGMPGMQNNFDNDENKKERDTTWGRDSTKHKKTKPIPMGSYQWVLEPRLGTVIDAENNDTVVHNFQNWNNTDGYTGNYNYLGNIGSPRLNRIFMDRRHDDEFMLLQPLSYFRDGLKDFRFTNTKSPITNLAYHKVGNTQNGEDRVRAYFASNINKQSGLGFLLDYLYGRGYYNSSSNSMFGGTVYGYYRGDRYNVHSYVKVAHMKMFENGGIEDDDYIENPQTFQQSYTSTDIPVMMSENWNRNHEIQFYLTHKYNLGYKKEIFVPDSLKPQVPSASELLDQLNDSIRKALRTDSIARTLALDSLTRKWKSEQIVPMEFIPVSSIIHTFDLQQLKHTYIARNPHQDYYSNNFFSPKPGRLFDDANGMAIRNTFGLALREGFNKWAQMGFTFFATHKLRTYHLLQGALGENYTENDLSVGGEVARTQGKYIHYNVNGEVWLTGVNAGNFTIDGKTDLDFKFGKKDSLHIDLHANVKHEMPDFFFRHFHSLYTWYDHEDLDRQLSTRIEGSFSLKRFGTKLNVGVENITNYTYFGIGSLLMDNNNLGSLKASDYSYSVDTKQYNKNIQVISAKFSQDLKFGPVHWDNELAFQKSSNEDVLPLPTISAYSNLYLLFRVAKVLRIQAGGDIRYFTKYYAPGWAPSIQQFAVQDESQPRVEIGNYPIINVYANLHIKHCRIYLAVNHVNAGDGHSFLVPHYAINPLTFRFGVSWNFFN